MKKIILAMVVVIITMSSCSLYDLRPDTLTSTKVEESNRDKARKLIAQSAKVHGWDSVGNANLTLTYKDEWPGFLLRTFFRPWPASSVNLKHSFGTKDLYTSSIELMDGKKKGEVWGLENKETYKIIDGQKVIKKNDDVLFYLPAYQYFIEIGIWAQDIPEVTYVGEQKIKGINYEVVFGTWNNFEPQKDVDQYLLYFEKQTKRLAIVAYTLRDVMASGHGVNWFSDFKEQDGFLLPFEQTITGGIDDDKIIHKITISEASVERN